MSFTYSNWTRSLTAMESLDATHTQFGRVNQIGNWTKLKLGDLRVATLVPTCQAWLGRRRPAFSLCAQCGWLSSELEGHINLKSQNQVIPHTNSQVSAVTSHHRVLANLNPRSRSWSPTATVPPSAFPPVATCTCRRQRRAAGYATRPAITVGSWSPSDASLTRPLTSHCSARVESRSRAEAQAIACEITGDKTSKPW